MRALFLVLLLANVGFFAWARYLSAPEPGADAAPLARQLEPEKLKIIPPAELPPPAPPAAPKPAAAPPPPLALKCIEWGSFTLGDAARAEKALEPLALGPRLAQRRAEETAGWWVFIPSQKTRQGAQRKAAELKQLGIEEYFIMQDEGPQRWSLSLGVFRTEEAAQARLAALRQQGVRTAQVGQRETVVPKVWLQVSGVDPATERSLAEIALQIEGSELRSCP
ncbi:MAG: SPOR domain-containing protein [Betaproteobacteria bacterium]